jgi:hypothetical protein
MEDRKKKRRDEKKREEKKREKKKKKEISKNYQIIDIGYLIKCML